MQIAHSRMRRSHGPVIMAALASAAILVTSVTAGPVMLSFHGIFDVTTSPSLTGCTFTNSETGTGTVQQLGTTAWKSTEAGFFESCSDGVPRSPYVVVNGAFTMTAANGDQINGTYTTWGTFDTNGVKVSGPLMFLSGTGRFTNVKGGGIITAQATTLTEATGSIDGVIKY